jgi:hypothetical protein
VTIGRPARILRALARRLRFRFVRGDKPAWLADWLERHQSRLSFWLHVVGIPLTVIAVALGIWQLYHGLWDLWWRPLSLLAGGYLLQWVGHVHEGNDMGEIIAVKRLLGRPYVAVSPRFGGKAPIGSTN